MSTPTESAAQRVGCANDQSRSQYAAHTPTPWKYRADDRLIVTSHEGQGILGTLHIAELRNQGQETEANAAFIVRACNSHAELVAALCEVSRESGADNLTDAIDRLASLRATARAALSRAKGGSQ